MNIDKFKQQHQEIIACIKVLRTYTREGINSRADEISRQIIAMSSIIKLHLAVEDSILYPALQNSCNSALASMGEKFQDEMTGIASAYLDFARKWNAASHVAADPEGFRNDANTVLKVLHDRMQRENRDFYPEIEASWTRVGKNVA